MKIDRLVAIIMLLNNREKITAKELAEKFQVSTKTIQRDIEIIERAGIPIVSYKGHGGGYGIIEGYKVSNSSMTKEEVSLLNKLLRGINKSYENVETTALINKFEAVKPEVNNLSDRLIIDFSKWGKSEDLNHRINLIDRAILNRNKLGFDYINGNGESTTRVVEPYKIIFKSLSWYVYGFCTLKKEMRIFKINRMKSIEIRDEQFTYREDVHMDIFKEDKLEKTEITIRFMRNFKGLIMESFEDYEELNQEGELITAIIKIPYNNWVEGMILSFGEAVEVISPIFLRENIKSKIEKISALYK